MAMTPEAAETTARRRMIKARVLDKAGRRSEPGPRYGSVRLEPGASAVGSSSSIIPCRIAHRIGRMRLVVTRSTLVPVGGHRERLSRTLVPLRSASAAELAPLTGKETRSHAAEPAAGFTRTIPTYVPANESGVELC
jgi:hypothetical protein